MIRKGPIGWWRRLNNEFGRPNLIRLLVPYEQKIKAHLQEEVRGYHQANYVGGLGLGEYFVVKHVEKKN